MLKTLVFTGPFTPPAGQYFSLWDNSVCDQIATKLIQLVRKYFYSNDEHVNFNTSFKLFLNFLFIKPVKMVTKWFDWAENSNQMTVR